MIVRYRIETFSIEDRSEIATLLGSLNIIFINGQILDILLETLGKVNVFTSYAISFPDYLEKARGLFFENHYTVDRLCVFNPDYSILIK